MIDSPTRDFLDDYFRRTAAREHADVVALAILRTHGLMLLRTVPRIDLPRLVQLFKWREQLCRESSPRKRAGTTMGAGILGDERRTGAARRRNSLCQATGGAPSGRGRGAGSFARSSEMTKRRECSQPEGWDTRAPELSPLPESQFSPIAPPAPAARTPPARRRTETPVPRAAAARPSPAGARSPGTRRRSPWSSPGSTTDTRTGAGGRCRHWDPSSHRS